MKRPLIVAATALVLAGCGTTEESSTDRFQGAEAAVAQKVEDLQSAGEGRQPEDICSDILARTLVEQLDSGDTTCAEEMREAIDDADDFSLEVRDVSIEGEQATARVQRGDDGPQATLEFARENGQWRATSLGS